jgi:F-type H+-transporting ATPase subunit b
LAFVAAPAISIAQEAAPAPASETAPASGDKVAQREAAEKAEKEETNTYRKDGAVVRWTVNTFHMEPEAAARLYEYINFAIIVFAVGIPLFKVIPGVLRKRSSRLSAELEVAQAKTMDANERLSAVEAKLAGLDSEIAAIRKQVEEDMKSDEARAKAHIEEETARIVASAEQEIITAGTLVQRGLKQFAADLAIDRAMSQLTLDADTDRALIAEFANDVTGKHGRGKGGKA